ncbi:MAG TPA: hypothetical protein VIS48_01540 [Candidatus Kryptonia bacterium]
MLKKGLAVFTALASLLTYWGCSKFQPGKFVMPTWDTQFSAPIFNRTYTLGEILHKDSATVSNGDTTFIYTTAPTNTFAVFRNQTLTGVPIGGGLQIAAIPTRSAGSSPLKFTINAPDAVGYSIPNGTPKGTTVPSVPAIPQQTFNQGPATPFKNFTRIAIHDGQLKITIHNGYPATVVFSNGQINLLDASNSPFLIPVNSIPPNQTFDTTMSIAGRVLTSNPVVSFNYSSPGSPNQATFQSDTLLGMYLRFSALEVDSATAVVPPQPPFTINNTLGLVDQNKIKSADIDSGFISFTFTNGFPVPEDLTVTLSSAVNQSNPTDTLKLHIPIQPFEFNHQSSVSLQGYRLQMADAFGNPTDSIRFSVTAVSNGSESLPDSFVNISTSQTIQSSFSVSMLQLASLTGEVHVKDPIVVANDTQRVDFGDFKTKFNGAITFLGDSTRLNLNISSVGVPYLVHLTLKPTSSASGLPPQDSVVVNQVIQPGQNTIAIGQEFAQTLNAFAIRTNTLPDEFIVNGYAVVNPGPPYSIGTVRKEDKVTGTNTISMPIYLGILGASYIDTTKTTVFDSATSARMGEVDSGRIVFEINNALPLQLSLVPQLIDTLTGAITPLDSVVAPAPTSFNSDGTVAAPTFRRNQITMTGTQAKQFARCYMMFKFSMQSPLGSPPGSQPVPFTSVNFVGLKVFGNLVFRVDKSLVGK